MFCPKCGKGEQAADSFCRSCGEFLTDYSVKSFLMKMLLGGRGLRSQVRINLVSNFVMVFISALLLGFLNGHFDALHARTGESPPGVINLVYVFLLLVMAWQLLGVVANAMFLRKMAGAKKGALRGDPDAGDEALASSPAQRSLQPGGPPAGGPESVTQHTTKLLDKLPRK